MAHASIAAAIMAGGQARRLGGQDKSRLVVEGRPIIVRQVQVLQRVAGELFVVGGNPARFADLGLRVHADRVSGRGVVGGIVTALEIATARMVIVVACDLPFLHDAVLRLLVERAAGHDGAWIETAGGVEPLLACYQKTAAPLVRHAIDGGLLKASDLGAVLDMAAVTAASIERFGPIDRLLANVNTPADYARVQYRPS